MGDLIEIDFGKKRQEEELTRREGGAFGALEEAMRRHERHERQKNIKVAVLVVVAMTFFVVVAMAFPFVLDYFVNSL